MHNTGNLILFSDTVKFLQVLAFSFAFFLCQNNCLGSVVDTNTIYLLHATHTENFNETAINSIDNNSRPYPILQLIRAKQKKNKKVTAAVLAFPFPFGIVGLHRIYLGTAPHVPVVYIGTLGGVLGILPFIDFCVLVLDKDIERFINNPKVLMWVDENKNTGK